MDGYVTDVQEYCSGVSIFSKTEKEFGSNPEMCKDFRISFGILQIFLASYLVLQSYLFKCKYFNYSTFKFRVIGAM